MIYEKYGGYYIDRTIWISKEMLKDDNALKCFWDDQLKDIKDEIKEHEEEET